MANKNKDQDKKVKQGEQPQDNKKDNSVMVAIISASATIIAALIGVLSILSKPSNNDIATLTPTSISTAQPTTIIETTPPSNILFSLENAKPEDFYTIKDASFVLLENKSLAIAGTYGNGVYLNQSLPENFKVTVEFKTEIEDQFIMGLSNGNEMRPNYHFVMTHVWTAFKQQQGFEVTENWDKQIKTTTKANFLTKAGVIYNIVFERKNGGVNISINNVQAFGFGTQDVPDIGTYDHLYLTGPLQRQIIINKLIVEQVD